MPTEVCSLCLYLAQVLVYSAPTGSTQAEWQEQAAAQLQQRLLTHMAATKWQVSAQGQGQAHPRAAAAAGSSRQQQWAC
jgi:hypothetical protein